MIQQIISHTPVYVWALLAFLVYRGVLATDDREVAFGKLFIIPAVMVAISLAAIDGHGPLGAGVWGVWLTGLLAGAALTGLAGKGPVVVNRGAGTVLQRGSWLPLTMMLTVFATKYAVAVMSAMHPGLQGQTMFVLAVSVLFGLFNGFFVGRLWRPVAAYARQPALTMA
ncbi:MAG TPA: DUF6622 family protein [Duganella sp.]|jgi:hypothetical protein